MMKDISIEQNVSKSGITLPHILPYMSKSNHINQRTIFKTFYKNGFENAKSFDSQALHYIDSFFQEEDLKKFHENSQRILTNNVVFDETLLDLFRTEYHIRLHWGSQGRFVLLAPENSDERHEEFEKVLTSLFEMCSMSSHNIYDV